MHLGIGLERSREGRQDVYTCVYQDSYGKGGGLYVVYINRSPEGVFIIYFFSIFVLIFCRWPRRHSRSAEQHKLNCGIQHLVEVLYHVVVRTFSVAGGPPSP